MDAPTESEGGWRQDWKRLSLLIVVAVGLHVWVIPHAEVAARDSIGFIRFAIHLEQPPLDYAHPGRTLTRLEVIQRSEHPPGYSVAIWLMSYPVRFWTGESLMHPDTMVLTCQLVSALAGILIIFPLYYVSRCVLDSRNLAFVAVLLLQTLPGFVEVTSDGLSDGLYLLGMVSTLAIGVWGVRSPSWWKFLLIGLMSGITYLIRPEGLMIAAATSVLFGLLAVRSLWTWRNAIPRIALLSVGVMMVFAPYVALTGKVTNKPTGNQFLKWLIGEEIEPVWKGQTSLPVSDGPLFASWYQGKQPKVFWAVQAFAKETSKTGFYAVPVLAILGLGLMARRIWSDPASLLVITLALMNATLILAVATMIGYLSERHTLLIVMLSCIFAAGAVPWVGRWIASLAWIRRGDVTFWTIVTVVTLSTAGLPVTLRPMHANRAGHHAAGIWLQSHAEHDALILDPFCWAEFYAGHAWGYDPPRPPHHVGPIYVIIEPYNASPHSRLPLIEMTRTMMRAGVEVYHWPEDHPVDESKVAIYRLVTNK